MNPQKIIEQTKNYVMLSNSHNLELIMSLFASDATYHSVYFGEYSGSDAIHTMMINFFTSFPDAHWEVTQYRTIENNGVQFEFIMTGMDAATGERIRRHGLERIYFTPDGLIKHIAVCKPWWQSTW